MVYQVMYENDLCGVFLLYSMRLLIVLPCIGLLFAQRSLLYIGVQLQLGRGSTLLFYFILFLYFFDEKNGVSPPHALREKKCNLVSDEDHVRVSEGKGFKGRGRGNIVP
ncbi:hypothetical protein L873DRAFT_30606 [Choiromyces venosus 120613-1]|uniref:Transmembrane protein n=1 Tax=Choiromyces venosus 120613-1 TaxID=1336337 RepID=A0A3N4KA51_9PEZI|nr:hypothetical protein L873DRAFT_30606 [Choiromyces venosus 120613-1]